MKNGLIYLAFLGVILTITLAGGCEPERESCIDKHECAKVPDNRIPDQLIIELKNFYTKDDLVGEIDSFSICPSGEDFERYDFRTIPPDDRCSKAYYTGEKAFLRDLNNVVYGAQSEPHITGFEIIDTCKCAEEIILIQILGDLLDVNMYDGVVAGTTSTKEENNGSIGAIGYNYDLKDIAKFNDQDLVAARGPAPDSCGISIFLPLPVKEGAVASNLKLVEKPGPGNTPKPNPQSSPYPGVPDTICYPVSLTPGTALADSKRTDIIRVAVVDTGADPYYNYRSPGGTALPDQADAFTFTEEVSFLQTGMNQFSRPYGAPITGNTADLNANCLSADYYGYDYKNGDNNPADRKGHGTHIAHTILTANEVPGEKVRVMPLQFGDYEDLAMPLDSAFKCDLFAAICAINYANKNGADIINMSWGYFAPEENWVLRNRLEEATDKNILMVASAGNDGRSVDNCLHWPSNYSTDADIGSHLISVAALDTFSPPDATGQVPNLKMAVYSNFGMSIDLAAPGTNIASALVHSGYRTVELHGTSMAAGVISRRAAILMGGNNAAKLPGDQVKQLILAETISDGNVCIGGGRLYNPVNDDKLRAAIGYD